ncbi:hypothetical protein CORC01_07270 [Colletotrichum orchidophilum]|uniref:Uncharacterized protein n=1 Tax=Colletotrichum orchidophilum TaxID=1209926 RepID=A0A1G4B7R1_9PEZI|nr:uncharacterized protein CORC01_07270 [Colletotrichum orchidophilum]OHE97488.1 hypothetical protein CORC01_07270 [Colletotrichum orchidophilum]
MQALFCQEQVTRLGSGSFFLVVSAHLLRPWILTVMGSKRFQSWRYERTIQPLVGSFKNMGYLSSDSGALLFPQPTLHAISSPVRLVRWCTQDHCQTLPLSPPSPQPRVVFTMITGEVLGPLTPNPRSAYRIRLGWAGGHAVYSGMKDPDLQEQHRSRVRSYGRLPRRYISHPGAIQSRVPREWLGY